MFDQIEKLTQEIQAATAQSQQELEDFRLKYISRKSVVAELFSGIKDIAPEDKKEFGQKVNGLKNTAQAKFQELIEALESTQGPGKDRPHDLTLPNIPNTLGSVHPITQTREQIIEIFERIGFNVSDGPEIEEDWYNFTSLNFPPNHPAREMQDTFFIQKDPDILLRTHTSNVQTRLMSMEKPPFRSIMPGRVFRNEAISARSHCLFHQVEGLYVDKNVSFADLKNTLYYFAKEMFGHDIKVRFRPSYFPFTEPSAEVDIYWGMETELDRKMTKGTGWLEILGCGMVDPNVLSNCGIDPEEYTGFAFGMGIERIALYKHKIEDIRLFFENDVRFLKQFTALS
ncbi:phenylalanine--tRNA ligase subunit alpha [Rapidithrix thailandica]|uniref:Phenylalanine--tRNA ligase alpha subunit n=1 Tax=Rapidithrix thailandica TaxID=413964 RepID=A0AAW9S6X9_9BACT